MPNVNETVVQRLIDAVASNTGLDDQQGEREALTREFRRILGVLVYNDDAVETQGRAQTCFEIVRDEDGTPHTRCPVCLKLDQIVEVDVAVRWNTLNLSGDGLSATASVGDGDWEGDSFRCAGCGAEGLAEPEGFEIVEWY